MSGETDDTPTEESKPDEPEPTYSDPGKWSKKDLGDQDSEKRG